MPKKKNINILKNKNTILFVAGAFSSLSFAPTYYIFLLYFALPILFNFLDNESNIRIKLKGSFFFGFGHFLISFYWISGSLLIDLEKFWFLLPFSLMLLPIFFSLIFIVPQGWLFSLYSCQKVHKKIVVFSSIWVIFEILRSNLFYGFPWNLIGYSLIWNQYLLQIASYFGPYGMSLLVMISGLMPVLYIRKKISLLRLLTLELVLILPFIIIGHLITNYSMLDNSQSLNVRIIQANIPQKQRWKTLYQEKTLQKYIDMTLKKTIIEPDIIIWPESANDFVLSDQSNLKILGDILLTKQYLITGIDRVSRKNGKLILNNSLIVINNKGNIIGIYNKSKLVPFGEFIPLKQFLPISIFTSGLTDYSPGNGIKSMGFEGDNLKRFIPYICFEAIFSNKSKVFMEKFDFLVNITNDSWFGISSGPYQHFAMARVRAVEAGAPLIRVAVTGISALINSFGAVVNKTKLNDEAILDFKIPEKKSSKNLYIVYGDSFIIFIIIMLLLYGNCNLIFKKFMLNCMRKRKLQ